MSWCADLEFPGGQGPEICRRVARHGNLEVLQVRITLPPGQRTQHRLRTDGTAAAAAARQQGSSTAGADQACCRGPTPRSAIEMLCP